VTSSRAPSRREFLAASAAGLVALARGEDGAAVRAQPREDSFGAHAQSSADSDLLYIGSYTDGGPPEGIHIARLDRRSGKLRLIASVNGGANPSFLAVHPGRPVLYAVNEIDEYKGRASGAVRAFAIAADTGAITLLGEQPSEGAAPCFVSVDRGGRMVLVANYTGGSLALLPIGANGALGPAAQVVQHHGTGADQERQSGPHAHCILADPTNRFALSADLGVDRVYVYRIDGQSLRHADGGDAIMRPGSGPRHIAFHPTLPLVFIANELDSTVATLGFDRERGTLGPSPRDIHSTVPEGWTGRNYPADIHFASSGRTLYVSNRGHNSLAVFSVAESTGALTLDQVIATGGDWPRNFTLDPSGRWLLVANQRSDSVVVFERDPATGRLTPTKERIAVKSPVCVRFLAPVK